MNGFNGMGWGMGIGWFFGVMILLLVIWLVFGKFAPFGRSVDNSKSALDILNQHFANGKLSKEEYEDKKRLIK
jgi:uncharacterized membrane protein